MLGFLIDSRENRGRKEEDIYSPHKEDYLYFGGMDAHKYSIDMDSMLTFTLLRDDLEDKDRMFFNTGRIKKTDVDADRPAP